MPRRARLSLLALTLSLLVLASIAASAGPGRRGSDRIAVVRGRSMEPILHTGDIVFLVHKDPESIKVGDVVVYREGATFIIHRVVYKYRYADTWCYVVWGDNNPIPDPGDPMECGVVSLVNPATHEVLTGVSGIPYSWIVGVVYTVHGSILKIPYLGGLALLAR